VVLEFELKSEIQKAIHAARKADPEREMAEIEQAVAERFELPFSNDRVQIRDARIAYELDQGSRTGHEDIEVLTGIRVRLIALDYVLENSTEHYLELSPARLRYFGEVRRIPREMFTDGRGSLIAFLDSFPISLADRASTAFHGLGAADRPQSEGQVPALAGAVHHRALHS